MRTAVSALALVAVLVSAGCGESASQTEQPEGQEGTAGASSTTAPADSATPSATEPAKPSPKPDEGQVIEMTFKGDTVSPNGDRVEVSLAEPIILKITADAPGELHIHSSPEQELAYEAGSSEHTLEIERPGIVEVESHDLGVIVVQLEVTP